MLFWIALAGLTAGVIAALLRPLASQSGEALAPAEADLSVYRDQLKEIETDRERGLIGADEAEAARSEVGRRLIARAGAEGESQATDKEADGAPAKPSRSRATDNQIRNAIAVVVPLMSLGFYLLAGSPGMPSRPHTPPAQVPVQQASQEQLLAMVEARLREVPEDGRGWEVIAPVYFALGRFSDAETAFANANRILGESPKRLKGMAESNIIANNGLVTEDARKAFQRLLALEPDNGEAKFALALALEQDGKLAEAADAYRALLSAAPQDAPWRPSLEVRLARLMRGGATPEAGGPAPEGMSKPEQEKFIAAMVERLAARLKTESRDLAGWQQLVRSYKVLGRESDAESALKEARTIFADDQKSLSTLNEFAASLGFKS